MIIPILVHCLAWMPVEWVKRRNLYSAICMPVTIDSDKNWLHRISVEWIQCSKVRIVLLGPVMEIWYTMSECGKPGFRCWKGRPSGWSVHVSYEFGISAADVNIYVRIHWPNTVLKTSLLPWGQRYEQLLGRSVRRSQLVPSWIHRLIVITEQRWSIRTDCIPACRFCPFWPYRPKDRSEVRTCTGEWPSTPYADPYVHLLTKSPPVLILVHLIQSEACSSFEKVRSPQ